MGGKVDQAFQLKLHLHITYAFDAEVLLQKVNHTSLVCLHLLRQRVLDARHKASES